MNYETVSKCSIFREMSPEDSKEWFSYSRAKFINHIDTLYFVIYPVGKWKTMPEKQKLVEDIRAVKAIADESRQSQEIFPDVSGDLEVRPWFGFQMYNLHFGKRDFFDVFICDNPPNDDTPPIFVQIRSYSLWNIGTRDSFDLACDTVDAVLSKYGIQISRVQENRIDYAFHTNYIQDMIHFFPEESLREMQISNFTRWHKEGCFTDNDIFSDYFTLGRRKSNNVFFRVYNKCKEVIEMNYKQFFFPLWQSEGLISKFDKYVLEKAFIYGNYASKEKARCEFYLSYGKDTQSKIYITQLLDNPDTPPKSFKRLADKLVPDITIVSNVEFQTKRKYYDRLDIPRTTVDTSYKLTVSNVLDNYFSIVNKLTTDTIRFVRYKGAAAEQPRLERPVSDWWQRLRTSKRFDGEENEQLVLIMRDYQRDLDMQRRKHIMLNGIASNSAYLSQCRNTPFENDIYDVISALNDNDICYYYRKKAQRVRDLTVKGLIEND